MRWTTGVLMGATALTLAAGCGTAPDTDTPDAATSAAAASAAPVVPGRSAGGPGEAVPKTANVQEALEVVNQQFELLGKSDWAKAWDLWTDKAKAEIKKDVFVETNKACPLPASVKFELERVTPVDDKTVEVGWRRDGVTENGASRLAAGKWQFDPGTTLVEYASGADAAIKKRKDGGKCTKK